jgi:hypothetical protein
MSPCLDWNRSGSMADTVPLRRVNFRACWRSFNLKPSSSTHATSKPANAYPRTQVSHSCLLLGGADFPSEMDRNRSRRSTNRELVHASTPPFILKLTNSSQRNHKRWRLTQQPRLLPRRMRHHTPNARSLVLRRKPAAALHFGAR